MKLSQTTLYLSCAFLAACGTTPIAPSDKHIKQASEEVAHDNADIPQANKRAIPLPPPTPAPKVETYSVVVSNVSAQEILFALARDAKINIDIHSGIEGNVTLNAINQTLPQILSRIAQQVDMRYELSNGNLVVKPDDPYLKQYKIDYVNMSRDSDSTVSNSSQLSSGAAGGASSANNSLLSIKNSSKNHFWDTLTKNIIDILHETDLIMPEGSSETTVQKSLNASTTGTGAQTAAGKKQTAKAGFENSPNPAAMEEDGTTVTRRVNFREKATVISNPESGIITVRATGRQHEKIQEFVDQVMASARRQVLIEATIVEVRLNDNYQQGIDWSKLLTLPLVDKGFTLKQVGTALSTGSTGQVVVGYSNPGSQYGDINATVSLLETFGNVKVLSSPKLSVMNNQTAMLRVVNNEIYFIVKADIIPATSTSAASASYSTTANSIAVGLTMSITPQISDNDSITINVRPSISSTVGAGKQDPNPILANPCGFGVSTCNIPKISNIIPEIQTREMESIIKIENGQTAVMGGLIKEELNKNTQEIPLLGRIPLLGNLFQNRNDTTTKTELVIFLRPVVIKDSSLNGDYRGYRNSLPNENFFKEDATGAPTNVINR